MHTLNRVQESERVLDRVRESERESRAVQDGKCAPCKDLESKRVPRRNKER